MGGPKALLAVRWGEGPGELPLAIAHARAMLDGGAERVVVVTRASVARELSRFAQRGLDIVVSTAEASLGPSGSIRFALEFLASRGLELSSLPLVLLTPVDLPPASASIRSALLGALLGRDASSDVVAARPTFEGRRGHPVVCDAEALAPFVDGAPPTLRDVLAALGARVVDVPVNDPRAVTDLDTPEDVLAWYKHAPRFFEADAPSADE
jgi:CTP:molybdopterin cytidylyltransferase MocA